MPVKIVAGVTVNLNNRVLTVKGPKGELKLEILKAVNLEINADEIIVKVEDENDKKQRSLWGLFRNLINNMIVGVSEGFMKKLEIKGVGYRAQASGQKLILNLGFSHPVEFPLPTGISALVEANIITISGFDKQLVGETAAQIRRFREPEPYQGKGIKYIDEVIRRKEGKTAASK